MLAEFWCQEELEGDRLREPCLEKNGASDLPGASQSSSRNPSARVMAKSASSVADSSTKTGDEPVLWHRPHVLALRIADLVEPALLWIELDVRGKLAPGGRAGTTITTPGRLSFRGSADTTAAAGTAMASEHSAWSRSTSRVLPRLYRLYYVREDSRVLAR